MTPTLDLRTVWLSDVHLGTRDCRADLLRDFLNRTRCDTLYLVGDVIDLESLKRSVYWPPAHSGVLRVILAKSQQGTRVVYIPGNHDDALRALCGTRLGNIEVVDEAVHRTRAGRRLLVMHGDRFDGVLACGPLARAFGSAAYRVLLTLNRFVHWLHEKRGRPYWSLAQHVKARMRNAVRYIERFESVCLDAAAEADLDGVVCGHIHKPALLEREGLLYCNDGDWVESCTALVEDRRGRLALVGWPLAHSVESDAAWPAQDAA